MQARKEAQRAAAGAGFGPYGALHERWWARILRGDGGAFKVVGAERFERGVAPKCVLLVQDKNEKGGAVHRLVFKAKSTRGPWARDDNYLNEVFAFHASRLLGVDRVPAAASRCVDGAALAAVMPAQEKKRRREWLFPTAPGVEHCGSVSPLLPKLEAIDHRKDREARVKRAIDALEAPGGVPVSGGGDRGNSAAKLRAAAAGTAGGPDAALRASLADLYLLDGLITNFDRTLYNLHFDDRASHATAKGSGGGSDGDRYDPLARAGGPDDADGGVLVAFDNEKALPVSTRQRDLPAWREHNAVTAAHHLRKARCRYRAETLAALRRAATRAVGSAAARAAEAAGLGGFAAAVLARVEAADPRAARALRAKSAGLRKINENAERILRDVARCRGGSVLV